jgi:hypothetical protein
MKTHVNVNQTDEHLILRILEIKFPRTTIKTPLKAVNKSIQVGGVNEIFHTITQEQIKSINIDSNEEQKFNKNVLREKTGGMVNLFFLSYQGEVIPEENEMCVMADLQYVHSDMAIIPLCPKLLRNYQGEPLKKSFLDYIQNYFKILETLNDKTIGGLIPIRMPRQFIPPLIEFYHSNDITSFVIDSDGTSIYSNLSWLKSLQRNLFDLGILEDGFLYNINSGEGKFMKNADVILARDFITLPFGIDILGSNHKPPPLGAEGWNKIKASRYKGPRVFDPLTYGYVRIPDPNVKRADVKTANISRQYGESVKIQKVINEENTAAKYIYKKQQVKKHDIVSLVERVKNDIWEDSKQKSLFDAF